MALRVMLVGLVASLGLDLPSSQDLARMARRSLDWVSSQAANIEKFVAELAPNRDAGPAVMEETPEVASIEVGTGDGLAPTTGTTGPTPTHPTTVDRPAIEVVDEPELSPSSVAADPIDGRFDSIVSEMASEFAERAGDVEAPAALAGSGEDPFPGVAYAMNREADGIEDEWLVEEVAGSENRPQVVVSEEPDEDTNPRAARLGTAVRLTGQAIQAWMSVLQQRTPTCRIEP